MTDDQIVSAVRAGDREAFGRLIDRHAAPVYAYARTWVSAAAEAEEVTQDTFAEAFLSLSRYREGEGFGAWLRGISRNLIRHRLRSRHRRREAALVEACLDLELPAPLPALPLEPLAGCLKALDDASRRALEGFYRHSRPLASLAQELGKAVSTVGSILHRARHRLRECLKRHGLEEFA
jgi:RNA polymerase sigma-70 factor (ECF subfamily)